MTHSHSLTAQESGRLAAGSHEPIMNRSPFLLHRRQHSRTYIQLTHAEQFSKQQTYISVTDQFSIQQNKSRKAKALQIVSTVKRKGFVLCGGASIGPTLVYIYIGQIYIVALESKDLYNNRSPSSIQIQRLTSTTKWIEE
jgi:hypothetical protein